MQVQNSHTEVSLMKGSQMNGINQSAKLPNHQSVEPAEDLLEKEWDLQMGVVSQKVEVQVVKIETSKTQKEQLFQSMKISAVYSMGSFLKAIQIYSINPSQPSNFSCQKISGFPCSQFKIVQEGAQKMQYQLSSNMMGTRYDLKLNNRPVMSIIYDVSCQFYAKCRQVNIYALRPAVTWQQLYGTRQTSDLKELYHNYQHFDQMVKMTNVEPVFSHKFDKYSLNFSNKKNLQSSVNNSVIANLNGQRLLEMFQTRTEQNTFHINKTSRFPELWAITYAIASLDFKIAIE